MNLGYWTKGVRLYIGIGAVLMAAEIALWAHAVYGPTATATLRIEEIYAWLAVGLLAFALSIGPADKLFPHLPGKPLLYDARRLLGVSAAWFASLHVIIAYLSLFKAANPLSLAKLYQQSFVLGILALIILLLMAGTSFDSAFRRMGAWWFRLHRLAYVAGAALLLHAFMIGAHATMPLALIVLAAGTLFILLMHVWLAFSRGLPTTWQLITTLYMGLVLLAIFNYGLGRHLGYNLLEALHGMHGGHHH